MNASFASKIADALSQISYARNVESEAVASIADAIRELDADIPMPPDPPIEPVPPDPEPEPEPTTRSIWGWNANHCLFYSNGRPWNNKALLTSIHQRAGATFNKYGELLSGEGLLPIWLSATMAEPGDYVVASLGAGPRNPGRFTLADSVQLQQFNITIRGDCRGLSVRREGDASTTLCTAECIARHRNAGAIRLMDLRRTNEGDARNGTHYRVNMSGSSPIIEQTITPYQAHHLATDCGGTPIWWCWHHRDSDEFISEVCEEFRTRGGTYPIYFEMSNELWGPFPQGAWADAYMNEPQEGRYKWLNKRTREMSAIAKDILGGRAIIVLGTQCTNTGVTMKELAGGTDGIDCLAVAAYLNWFREGDIPTSFADGLTKIRQHTDTQILPSILEQRDIAYDHGLRLVAYECGTDISWHNAEHLRTLYSRINESEEVAKLYEDFMDWWEVEVNDLCLFYSDTNHHGYGHYAGERMPPYPRGAVVQNAIGAAT